MPHDPLSVDPALVCARRLRHQLARRNGLVATGVIRWFSNNYQTKDEPDRLAITINERGDADTIRAKVLDALAEAAEGAEIIIEPA